MWIHAKNGTKPKDEPTDEHRRKPRSSTSYSRLVYVEVRTCADSKQPYDASSTTYGREGTEERLRKDGDVRW